MFFEILKYKTNVYTFKNILKKKRFHCTTTWFNTTDCKTIKIQNHWILMNDALKTFTVNKKVPLDNVTWTTIDLGHF